jgi:hypothetical protein
MENCMKINRQTGEVMWILGGKLNQFTFQGCDPDQAVGWFDGHDLRRLENGNVLFFDNSDGYGGTDSSHVVEFRLDEENLIAELLWRYLPSPIVRGPTRAGAQRQANGNTMICWGSGSYWGGPVCTEVNAAGEKLFELKWTAHQRLASYRAFRFPVDYQPTADTVVDNLLAGQTYVFLQDGILDSGVSINIDDLAAPSDNQLKVTTYDWAPLNPTFAGHDPQVYKNRIVVSATSVSSIAGAISFDTSVFDISNPDDITIYHRPAQNHGRFSPLNTVYQPDESAVTADFTDTGEFIIGCPDLQPVPFAPNPILPAEAAMVNDRLPVRIQWSPRGFITVFDLQIATDPEFANVVADEYGLTSTIYEFADPSPETTYYWRVKTHNHGGASNWSQTASFTATAPYIVVTAPDAGDSWTRGLDYFITWQDNLDDQVVIELYKSDQYLMTIDTADSDGGYRWEADLGLQAGCDYSIKLKSLLDESVFAMSGPFRIDMNRGDFDCDGCVGLDDLNILAAQWLDEPGGITADADGDGAVNANDLAVLAESWMKECP